MDPKLLRHSFEMFCMYVASLVGFFVAYGMTGSVVVAGLTLTFLLATFTYIIMENR